MDSNLDIKYKKFINNVYPKEKKNIPILLHKKISQPLSSDKIKKKNPKLVISTRNDVNFIQRINLINKLMKNHYNRAKFELKKCKSISNNNIKNNDIIINNSIKRRNKLVPSDILPQKSIFLTLRKQFSINSLINNSSLNKNEENKFENLKKNINEFISSKKNERDLKQKSEEKIFKKMTRFALRNKLYFKHSSMISGERRIKNYDDDSNYYYKNKKNKEDTKENLTKSEPSTGFNFNNVYKRNLNFPNIQINKQIINKDQQIYFNCLFSKINAKLNEKKLFPNKIVKTIFGIQNENSYKRIHSLDKIFSKLMKN